MSPNTLFGGKTPISDMLNCTVDLSEYVKPDLLQTVSDLHKAFIKDHLPFVKRLHSLVYSYSRKIQFMWNKMLWKTFYYLHTRKISYNRKRNHFSIENLHFTNLHVFSKLLGKTQTNYNWLKQIHLCSFFQKVSK